MTRYAFIDQWRGVSVLMVVLNHLALYRLHDLFSLRPRFWNRLFEAAQSWAVQAGNTGVDIFFVISGFVITRLLAKGFTFRVFYIRRTLRIWPAMFAYVAAVTLLGIGPIVSPWQDSILASAFLCNVFGCGRSFWHFWSLSVEEQFYLLWPLLFVLLDWRGALVAVVVGLTCSALALGVMGAWLDNGLSFACIGVGALYALSEPFRRCFAWAKTLPAWLFPALLIGAVPYVRSRWGGTLVLPFVIVAAVLVRHEDGSFGKASRPLLFLGAVSFSLYLWQGPMTWEAERYSSPGAMYAVTALAIVATWVSYRWVERPMIRLAHRLTSRAPS